MEMIWKIGPCAPKDVVAENGEQTMYESYAMMKPADGVVAPGHVRMNSAHPAVVRKEDGSYDMDLAAIEKQLQAGAKLMLLCNPHNPVGRAWTKEELTALWQLLQQYDCALVSDEIHMDFVLGDKPFVPMLSIAR